MRKIYIRVRRYIGQQLGQAGRLNASELLRKGAVDGRETKPEKRLFQMCTAAVFFIICLEDYAGGRMVWAVGGCGNGVGV